MASIEEMEPEDDNEPEDEEEVAELAARTSKLSADQREEWVKEMRGLGVNF